MLVEALISLTFVLGGSPPPFGGSPAPSTVVGSFRAEARTTYGDESYSWQAPERIRVAPKAPDSFVTVERDGTRYGGASLGFDGTIERRAFAARPDAYSEVERFAFVEFPLGRARSGSHPLTEAELAGRPALTASFAVRENECAGRPRGRAQVWLDPETLLPLRYVERLGSGKRRRTYRASYTYSSVNESLPDSEFAPPPLGKKPLRSSRGFRRTTPEEAASHLSYAPLLPTVLPPGFALAVAGWAPRSSRTGAEASNPRYPELFGAVYRRGFERIDVTQRVTKSGDWPGDPFGVECGFLFYELADVNGAKASFGTAPGVTPHLVWRKGRLLLTVSGPFPKRDLVAIAESLAPVGA